MSNVKPKTGNHLHRKLRDILCKDIYTGKYPDGAFLPAEREMAKKYGVSRVTVRGTLARMEQEGLISRRQGDGTRIHLRTSGFQSDMDIIVVLAPAENPFFSSFINHFDAAAEANDTMVVFKAIGKNTMEDILFKFYQRGIRNAVVWPYDAPFCNDAFRRLRGLGMNIVLFDRVTDSGVVDCVSVDNEDAVIMLYKYLHKTCSSEVAYLGWENHVITSNMARESAFAGMGDKNLIYRLPWKREDDVDPDISAVMEKMPHGIKGIICGNGIIGIGVKKYCLSRRKNLTVACIDNLPGADTLSLTTYAQPMAKLASEVYTRLLLQGKQGENWNAKTIYIKGALIRR
ncbi:MAG: hypothetical protein A2283_12375 [Lentisphaerae bacterium RIFOXYA12_FULL_48_11]|nr:MAG: hypothetical protein A2283_12375 [Lentisphaerae bacterium RIFOXYA12_FULL_48_11]